jgi:hypothetical protein
MCPVEIVEAIDRLRLGADLSGEVAVKCLTIEIPSKYGPETYEIHMLNVGDDFHGFGGSKHSLTAGRDFYTGEKQKKPTASLIVRRIGFNGLEDREHDIHDPNVWRFICACINLGEATAEVPEEPAAGSTNTRSKKKAGRR